MTVELYKYHNLEVSVGTIEDIPNVVKRQVTNFDIDVLEEARKSRK